MTGQKGRSGSGGVRPGAGRPRSTVTLKMPPVVIEQLEEVAYCEHVPLVAVVQEAIITYLERWQSEHDAKHD